MVLLESSRAEGGDRQRRFLQVGFDLLSRHHHLLGGRPPALQTLCDIKHRIMAEQTLNDLGRIRLRSTTPILYDAYRRNRNTGSFILVDEATNATVAAGMLLAE